jgi:hypothetical protein
VAAPSGAAAIVVGVNPARAPWSSASFLAYLGGLTILAAVGSLLQVQSSDHAAAGFAGWAFVVFLVVTALALLARGSGHPVTAGLLALSSVAALVTLLGALLDWFGWLDTDLDLPFGGTRVSWLVLELSVIASAAVALRVFRFPLLVFVLAAGGWFFATDLISGGGDWSAVVTLLFGLALLGLALAVDNGDTRPYAFWLHVVAGLTIGGGLLWFFHDGDWDWALVAIAGVVYIALADRLGRSSWAVLGAWGMLQTAAHFGEKWSDLSGFAFTAFFLFPFVLIDAYTEDFEQRAMHPWASALVFALTGLVFIAIGLLLAHRRREAVL